MHFVFAFGELQLPVLRASCRAVLISLLFDSIYPELSGPASVTGSAAVIYNSVLEVYMRHPHTDPSRRSPAGPLSHQHSSN